MISLKPPSFADVLPTSADSDRVRRAVMDGVAGEAERIASAVRVAAPERTGALRESIRVEHQGSKVVIEAGGPLTTTETGFDYAVARELGTRTEEPHPFFFGTIEGERPELDAAAKASLPDLKRT